MSFVLFQGARPRDESEAKTDEVYCVGEVIHELLYGTAPVKVHYYAHPAYERSPILRVPLPPLRALSDQWRQMESRLRPWLVSMMATVPTKRPSLAAVEEFVASLL